MSVECSANCLHNCEGRCELEDIRLDCAPGEGDCSFFEERDKGRC